MSIKEKSVFNIPRMKSVTKPILRRAAAMLAALFIFLSPALLPLTASAAESQPTQTPGLVLSEFTPRARFVLDNTFTGTQGGTNAESTGVDAIDNMFDNVIQILSGLCWFIGGILVIIGVIQVGISFSSHDPTQRMTGFLLLAGGALIVFAPQILNFLRS